MDNYLPQTAAEYMSCFRQLASLTEKAIDDINKHTNWVSDSDKDKRLSRIAEAVETLSSLRGDSVIFEGARPEGLIEYQKEMYATEYALRDSLVKLGYKYPKR